MVRLKQQSTVLGSLVNNWHERFGTRLRALGDHEYDTEDRLGHTKLGVTIYQLIKEIESLKNSLIKNSCTKDMSHM